MSGSLCPDFSVVLSALDERARSTGQPSLRISGWEIEDRAIRPPAFLARRLAGAATRLRGYVYAGAQTDVKERAAQVLGATIRHGGELLTGKHIATLQNSTQALLLVLAALKEQGVQRLVIAAPCYFAAVRIAETLGLSVELVPARDFVTGELDAGALRRAVTGPRAALLLTNPAYSVGVEYGWPALERILASLPLSVPIVLDETRLGLSWASPVPWYTAAYPENVTVLRSPSKVFFIDGAKCAFVLAPFQLVQAIEQLSESLVGSLPGNATAVALAYLDAWHAWRQELLTGTDGLLLTWRAATVTRLRRNLAVATRTLHAHGFVVSPVNSGPYAIAVGVRERRAWPGCVEIACATGVLVMDTSYFLHTCQHQVGFRLNLCARPERTRVALERVLAAASPRHLESHILPDSHNALASGRA